MKKIYIESLGCAKNQVDSEVLLTIAKEKGYVRVTEAKDADLIFVNTCGFIESAKEESINTFFALKGAYPDAKIVLGGCLAQRYAEELELEEADAIFGNRDLAAFSDVLDSLDKGDDQIVLKPEYPDPDREKDEREEYLSMPRSCYLKISEGCDHRCSYCAIPIIRGGLRSRSEDRIIDEAKELIRKGFFEINLIAQDLGAYGTDFDGKSHFCDLLTKLASLEGDFRLRLLYIHPDTFPEELISIVKNSEKIIPYFDIPFQHSSERVLRKMRRFGNTEKYLALINRIRSEIPEAVIRTTLMLGFPGEEREDFDELLSFVRQARFDWMGSFLYSREEDTPAFDMRDEKAHEKAVKRAARWKNELEELQSAITEERLQGFVGKKYTALVEENIQGEDLSIARIYSQAPEVDGLTVIMGEGIAPGDVVEVGIRAVRGVDLEAVLIRKVK
ncbi:MAG: 30S ribosomal protein S12 methylthiotransferase RimO [Bullifex sp.]|nr:30S ribosomal protein S12 methylthiotransferase RimO [Bullifex sp.]MDY5057614.1 30S ribosomal protein S12 methylthiotransferase RimO [Bullifex sp.]MDY5908593.1 30S ribosomal protein S12 methylthiotransferase RimO [Bullifex sp.]